MIILLQSTNTTQSLMRLITFTTQQQENKPLKPGRETVADGR